MTGPRPAAVAIAALSVTATLARAQTPDSTRGYSPADCPSCAEWNAPAGPVRLVGDTWFVGTKGLSAILVTSAEGHVLIDAGLPESAPQVMASVRALGFRVEDIRLILNSHAHYDHAGGIAAIQRVSGARAAATPSSAAVLRRGMPGPDDPQHAIALPYPRVPHVRELADGDTVRVGPIVLTAHVTAGHTPGGTSWSWRACEGDACADVVYADSQTPVSADGFLFSRNASYPSAVADFERGHARLERLACDVLLTPHPGASRLWQRLEARERGQLNALRDPDACRWYAKTAREQLARRLASEKGK
jgi:metallo-beta-lactamase class B